MKFLTLLVYRSVVAPIGVLFMVTIGVLFLPKVRAGFRLRRQKREWPSFHRAPIWIHASSGEFEYAKPVIRELKSRDPGQPIVVTYFSPSFAEAIAKFPGVDFSLPLPVDLPGPTRAFLRRLKPCKGLIARTDLWPELLHQAKLLKIPIVLFSITKTKRPNILVSAFNRWLYGYLNILFAVSESDAEILKSIVPEKSVQAIGDTRFDQVLERLRLPQLIRHELKPDFKKTLVAGSTWAEDEKVLIKALSPLLLKEQLQLVIAPHEPTHAHLDFLKSEFQKQNIPVGLYSEAGEFNSGVLIVDKIGILAELYQWAALAFVGGSFKKSVHSVMEPLAAGCITIVGPYHKNNREALEFQNLQEDGTSFVQVARSAKELHDAVLAQQKRFLCLREPIRNAVASRGGASGKLIQSILTL